ncbi:HU family DNA-binding protein [Pseudomonas sp. FW306-1C-G01A]|jgi:DNA-binding protein HU-beta|uniref:DNA-binding protein HU-beta n=1 Tax=Pseudomonas syringae pv. actinidiae TaxID=103796 RepID=A0A7L7TKC3_PSESF|nr:MULTISPECIES: HU family DNA-binding protein [Pseudomonas]AVX93008.1 HU family DNA-binding protein [Pseudomonas koreensis]KPB17016.1 Bacterial nucleoid DNA-binding protein [Pseudomonas amygdali pv. sesami]OKS78860.1 DNA-binding protein HU [Pseudomonas syringae pv. actinidiae]PMV86678.1 HU family DNA-binding protein [Pseudomonas sp. GW101-1A09]PMV94435.1 HU family DNA-binding protein [Pseudomonas sp. FW306-2-2C-B10A]
MTKSDIVDVVAASTKLSKADAGRALASVLESIAEALKRGESVSIIGFGTFSVKHRAARVGRNPQNGQAMDIQASRNPSFKPGKSLQEAVNA